MRRTKHHMRWGVSRVAWSRAAYQLPNNGAFSRSGASRGGEIPGLCTAFVHSLRRGERKCGMNASAAARTTRIQVRFSPPNRGHRTAQTFCATREACGGPELSAFAFAAFGPGPVGGCDASTSRNSTQNRSAPRQHQPRHWCTTRGTRPGRRWTSEAAALVDRARSRMIVAAASSSARKRHDRSSLDR